MITSFDNNKDKVRLLLKDDVGGSRIRSRARSHDPRSRDHGDTGIYWRLDNYKLRKIQN